MTYGFSFGVLRALVSNVKNASQQISRYKQQACAFRIYLLRTSLQGLRKSQIRHIICGQETSPVLL